MLGMMEARLTLGEEVFARRKRAGLTQEQLGALIGKSRETVSQIERNERHDLKDDTLDGLEKHLGISKEYAIQLLRQLEPISQEESIATLFEIVAIKDRTERRR